MRLKKIQKSRRIAKAKNGRDTTDINVDAYAKLAKRKIKEYLRLMKKMQGEFDPIFNTVERALPRPAFIKFMKRVGLEHNILTEDFELPPLVSP
jgi:hypothetical protein